MITSGEIAWEEDSQFDPAHFTQESTVGFAQNSNEINQPATALLIAVEMHQNLQT